MLLQRVALVLESLNLPCELEPECTQTEYTIDIALPDIKLAIEVDGPLHFMRNVPKPTGRTAGLPSELPLLPFSSCLVCLLAGMLLPFMHPWQYQLWMGPQCKWC